MNLRTPLATKLVGSLSLVVVAGLGWMVVVGPETAALAETRAEIQVIRDQNHNLTLQLSTLERQASELGRTRQVARDIAEMFPPTADQPGLFTAVTAAAVDAGIGARGVTVLAPTAPVVGGADPVTGAVTAEPPAGGDDLARQTVTVSVSGGYDQTERLLENLEHMPRALLVTSVTVTGEGEAGSYTTTVVGDMFVMSPLKDPGKLKNVSSPTSE